MSRFLASAILLGCVMFTAAPLAQGGVAGAWDLTINGPQGSITASATMKQEKDAVTGTLSSPQGDVEVKGTIKGSTLTMAFTVQGPSGPLDIKLSAEVTGSDMKGVIDFGGGTADFTGKKK